MGIATTRITAGAAGSRAATQFRTETDGYARMFINDMFDSKEQRDIYWDKYECFKLDEDW